MASTGKKRLGLIFGGRSSEHEVSLTSARSVLEAVDRDTYDVELICITPEGRWVTGLHAGMLLEGKKPADTENVLMPQFPQEKHLLSIVSDGGVERVRRLDRIDVVFPLLHGTYGEDGTIQGLFELAGVPYVGAGVAGSAVGMDKIIMKDIFISRGLPVCDYDFVLRKEWEADRSAITDRIAKKLGFPVFTKPANAGSSVGITKVKSEDELPAAMDIAAEYDRKILIEKGLDAREIECSVLGNDDPEASVTGEIVPSREFYDYEAKYIDEGSKLFIPARIPEETEREIRDIAVKAFRALDCAGMSRVDFFLEKDTGKVYLNEVNTIPGFTPISMYPKLWEASGLSYSDLISRLIELAFERYKDRIKSRTTYTPKD